MGVFIPSREDLSTPALNIQSNKTYNSNFSLGAASMVLVYGMIKMQAHGGHVEIGKVIDRLCIYWSYYLLKKQ